MCRPSAQVCIQEEDRAVPLEKTDNAYSLPSDFLLDSDQYYVMEVDGDLIPLRADTLEQAHAIAQHGQFHVKDKAEELGWFQVRGTGNYAIWGYQYEDGTILFVVFSPEGVFLGMCTHLAEARGIIRADLMSRQKPV
jgi:hypothetical protein